MKRSLPYLVAALASITIAAPLIGLSKSGTVTPASPPLLAVVETVPLATVVSLAASPAPLDPLYVESLFLPDSLRPTPTPEPTPEPPPAPPAEVSAASRSYAPPPGREEIVALICAYDWPCEEALYVFGHESGLNPNAVNPYSGACGLVQLYPCTCIEIGCNLAIGYQKWVSGGRDFYAHWYRWWN